MIVRDAVESDWIACHAVFIAAVAGIGDEFYSDEEKRAWIDRFPPEELLARMGRFPHWVVEIDEVVAGFAALEVEKSYVDTMFVHPDFQGRGVGKALMERVLEAAREARLERVTLKAARNALEFYKGFGFVPFEGACDDQCEWMAVELKSESASG